MPEGHTIHRIARDQRRDLVGQPLRATSVQARFAAGAAGLDGQVLRRTEAWGKHLFHWYAGGDLLHVHLGLIGKWQRRESPAPPPVGELRLRLEGADHAWDLSGPMVCRIVTPDERDAVVSTLGPDPLRRDADPERMWSRLQRSDKPIGILLLEQDVVAGIGNVYRSELLSIAGIDPRRPGRLVTRPEFEALWHDTVRQLRLGVRRNRIVTMAPAEVGRPISGLARGEGRYAYQQETCGRCGTLLDVFALAGRTTWACATCQPG